MAGATVSEQVAVIHPCLYKDVLGTTGEKKEDVVGIFEGHIILQLLLSKGVYFLEPLNQGLAT